MPTPRYCFVSNEGAAVFRIAGEPTATDLEDARLGLCTIVRLADLCAYGRSGRWEPIPEGRLGTGEPEGAKREPFHAPPGDF